MRSCDVKVEDGVIHPDLVLQLVSLADKPIWQYGWKSNVSEDRFSFWHAHFAGGSIINASSCLAELNKLSPDLPIAKLWAVLHAKLLEGHEPVRAYGNAHTFGTEGYCHKDSLRDDYFSTIYYAHPVWNSNWGGELIFYNSDGDVLKTVTAKPGRLVHFRGDITHRVAPLTRECNELRVSIVFKTLLKRRI